MESEWFDVAYVGRDTVYVTCYFDDLEKTIKLNAVQKQLLQDFTYQQDKQEKAFLKELTKDAL